MAQDSLRIVSVKELGHRSSLSIASLYRLMQSGDLQRPAKLTAGRVGWPSSYIDDWLSQRVTGQKVAA